MVQTLLNFHYNISGPKEPNIRTPCQSGQSYEQGRPWGHEAHGSVLDTKGNPGPKAGCRQAGITQTIGENLATSKNWFLFLYIF